MLKENKTSQFLFIFHLKIHGEIAWKLIVGINCFLLQMRIDLMSIPTKLIEVADGEIKRIIIVR